MIANVRRRLVSVATVDRRFEVVWIMGSSIDGV
jgi:hypothetical protein